MTYYIGLLMVADEDDIIDRTLEVNREFVDAFYVLDGSDSVHVANLCNTDAKCWGLTHDRFLPEEYGTNPVDGWRQYLLEQAVSDHGPDHWFLLLHGDELWTQHPRFTVDGRYDGFIYGLPFFFPRAGEPWLDDVHPIDQLNWHLGPGYPEFRMFRGSDKVSYNRRQHFSVAPQGIGRIGYSRAPILHFPYRSPEVQRARAARHERTQFDPDNYRHITDGDEVYWTDEMIDLYRAKPWFAELRLGGVHESIGVR